MIPGISNINRPLGGNEAACSDHHLIEIASFRDVQTVKQPNQSQLDRWKSHAGHPLNYEMDNKTL